MATHGTGMHSAQEQLLNLSLVESTLFWTGLSFFVLLFVIWRFVVPVMGNLLQERQSKIRADLDRAAALKDEAQKIMAEYEKQLAAAQKEAHNIVANARSEAEKMILSKTSELERALARRSEDARVSIEQAKAKALREVRSEVANLAIYAAERIITEEVDAKKAEKLTDALLKEMH